MNLPWRDSHSHLPDCCVRRQLNTPLKPCSPSKESLIEKHCVKHFLKGEQRINGLNCIN